MTRSGPPRRRSGRESSRHLHPAAGGHNVADPGLGPGRDHRLSAAAGGAPAPGGFSHHLGPGPAARGRTHHHGHGRGRAPGTPVRPHCRGDGNDFGQFPGLDQHHLAVRPVPGHRRRGPGRPGRHQRRPGLSAFNPAPEPDLSEDQSGRRADSHPGPDFGDREPGPHVRRGQHRAPAKALPGRGRGPGGGGRRRPTGGARGRESGRPGPAGAEYRQGTRSYRRHHGQPAQGPDRGG